MGRETSHSVTSWLAGWLATLKVTSMRYAVSKSSGLVYLVNDMTSTVRLSLLVLTKYIKVYKENVYINCCIFHLLLRIFNAHIYNHHLSKYQHS